MNKAIFYQPWGGLGDNLQFSTLPELYHNIGVSFYVNENNVCRNPEITKLVWETNPYFKGYTNEEPNCGSNIKYTPIFGNLILDWEKLHGFIPKNTAPKLYYKSNIIELLRNKIVLSLQSISAEIDELELFNKIKRYLIDYNYNDIILLKYKNDVNKIKTFGKEEKNYSYSYNIYDVNNIFDLCDVIQSCDHFITLHSGASVLASALDKKTTVFIDKNFLIKFKFGDNIDKESGDFLFQKINYIGV